jgi:hypothetical protein
MRVVRHMRCMRKYEITGGLIPIPSPSNSLSRCRERVRVRDIVAQLSDALHISDALQNLDFGPSPAASKTMRRPLPVRERQLIRDSSLRSRMTQDKESGASAFAEGRSQWARPEAGVPPLRRLRSG